MSKLVVFYVAGVFAALTVACAGAWEDEGSDALRSGGTGTLEASLVEAGSITPDL